MICCAAALTDSYIAAKDSKKFGTDGYHTKMRTALVQSEWKDYAFTILKPNRLIPGKVFKISTFGYQAAVSTVRARLNVAPRDSQVIVDGSQDYGIPFCICEPKADANYPVVSLASCLAKSRQVWIMDKWDALYPEYGFSRHHGYGTDYHLDAIARHGMLPFFHRASVICGMARFKKTPPKHRELSNGCGPF